MPYSITVSFYQYELESHSPYSHKQILQLASAFNRAIELLLACILTAQHSSSRQQVALYVMPNAYQTIRKARQALDCA